jgi:hypothetical protein
MGNDASFFLLLRQCWFDLYDDEHDASLPLLVAAIARGVRFPICGRISLVVVLQIRWEIEVKKVISSIV